MRQIASKENILDTSPLATLNPDNKCCGSGGRSVALQSPARPLAENGVATNSNKKQRISSSPPLQPLNQQSKYCRVPLEDYLAIDSACPLIFGMDEVHRMHSSMLARLWRKKYNDSGLDGNPKSFTQSFALYKATNVL